MAETIRSEGLWKRHFHWSVLLRWEVLGWILASLLAMAGILLFFDQYWWANACFIATSVFIFAKVVQVAVTSDDPWWHRMAFTFVLFGVFGVVIVESVRGVNRWAIKHSDVSPVSSTVSVLQPSVTLGAYLQPKQPYSEGIIIGGISWSSHYVDVRLDVANGPTQIKDLDFSVELDTSIAAVGQISQFQGVTAFPDNDPPAAWLEGTDTQGKPLSVPIVPALGMMRSSPIYRVHCTDVFANTVVHFVIASIALNQTTANGGLPQHLFAPRRAPRAIKVKGRYSVQEGESVKWYPFEFSHQFAQTPEIPREGNHPRVKSDGRLKPVVPAPLVAHIRIGSQKQVTSTDPDLPYGVEIVLQTDIPIDPVAFAVKCTGTIGHGQAGFVGGGNYDQFATGMAGNNSDTFEFGWKSPAFTADKPIRVTLYSKDYIQAVDVIRLNYSWNP